MGKGKSAKQQLSLPEPTIAALEAWLQIRGGEAGHSFTISTGLERASV
jgi:hypothetical protein